MEKSKKEIFMVGPDATQADINAVVDGLQDQLRAYHELQKRKKKKPIPRNKPTKKKRQ